MKRSHWILTVKRNGNFTTKTLFYEGNLVTFLLIEKELGNNRDILYSKEITKEEYEYAISEEKNIERKIKDMA